MAYGPGGKGITPKPWPIRTISDVGAKPASNPFCKSYTLYPFCVYSVIETVIARMARAASSMAG